MSTVSVANLKHPSSASNNIVLDANGNASVAGTMAMGTPFGNRNKIINGAMEIDQRAATVTVNAAGPLYSVDRWGGTGETADGVFTLAKTAAGPAGFPASLKATVTTADASIGASQRYIIQQRIEGNNIADLAWGSASAKPVTLSFWVFSSLTGTFGGFFRNSAGDRNYVFSYAVSAANTWEYKSIVVHGDTAGTWLTDNGIGIILAFAIGAGSDRVGTAGVWSANNHQAPTGQTQLISTNGATFYLTGVQLEVGSVATPFERRLYTTELQLCQRYYALFDSAAGAAYNVGSSGASAVTPYYFPVTMRASPTIAIGTLGFNNNVSSDSLSAATSIGGYYVSIIGGSAGNYARSRYNNTAAAEL